jgi:hypothetical protein
MINEITITAKFVTGTSLQNPEEAKAVAKKLFLDTLAKAFIYEVFENKNGLFSVQIQEVKSVQL